MQRDYQSCKNLLIIFFPFQQGKVYAQKKRPEGRSFMRREGFTYPSGSCPAENQERSPSLQLRRTWWLRESLGCA